VGLLTETQIARRKLRNVLRHTGANEAWTPSLIAPGDHERVGLAGADITVANPLNPDESVLRRSLLPGMLRALAFNLNRRQAGVRLFEVGNVFPVPDKERVDAAMLHADPALTVVDEREQAGLLLGGPGDDATSAVRAWRALSDARGRRSESSERSTPRYWALSESIRREDGSVGSSSTSVSFSLLRRSAAST
jgi:phenylalanyl-tRNA synthetase beta subunit